MHEAAQQALERVHLKAEYFVDIQAWPLESDFDPRGWLDNFGADDQGLAALMLDSFLFYPSRMTDALFQSTIQGLSSRFLRHTKRESSAAWRKFIDEARFCIVTGEDPNPSDSGYIFARRVRTILEIDEERVLSPEQCLGFLDTNPQCPVVFVDDFVGSGNQFVNTWNRRTFPRARSFSDHFNSHGNPFFYCPILATDKGAQLIRGSCPGVNLVAAHILDPLLSPLHPSTLVFPDDLRRQGHDMIERISNQIGVPSDSEYNIHYWRGYRNLACSLAFSHGMPDATLPIFHWEKNGWNPLMRRR